MNLPRYLKWKKNCRELHGYAPRTISRVAKQTVPSVLKRPVQRVMRSLGELPQVERRKPEFPAEFRKLSSLKKQLWWNTTREGLVELLRYADRNSMAHSREVRLPFLDHRLVEFVFRLPDQLLMRDGWTKWILREAFRGIVPAAITDRIDKLGYMPPQKRWLGNRVWPDLMLQQLTEMDELPARRAS
jgi:asparagine synthetase B (glutamine-hydrolysing)